MFTAFELIGIIGLLGVFAVFGFMLVRRPRQKMSFKHNRGPYTALLSLLAISLIALMLHVFTVAH